MTDVKCARALLDASERDVVAVRVFVRSGEVSDEVFGFHVQQGAEKALKAWIAVRGEMYPLTHDLEELFEILTASGVDAAPFEQLVGYSAYAVEFRYTGVPLGTDPIDRERALALVEELLERVRRELAAVAAN